MGRVHSKAFQEMEGVRLIGVAEPDPQRRAQAEQDLGVDTFAGAQDLLGIEALDLVDICVPTYLHSAVFQEALKARKHIFCEKPLARTWEEGEQILDLARGYPGKIGIGHVVRFMPQYLGIRNSVLAGEIGQAAVVRTFRGGARFPRGWQDWFSDFELSGGGILDLTIHDLDYLRWLFGEVERVYAKTTRERSPARLEYALIILRFKNGVIAHVEGSWANYEGDFYTKVEIAGNRGLINYDSREANPLIRFSAENNSAAAVAVPENPALKSPYFLELEDMIKAIREDRPPAVSAAEALASLKVALAAIKSAQTGQVITL